MYNTGEMQNFTPSMLNAAGSTDITGAIGFGVVLVLAIVVAGLMLSIVWDSLKVQS